MSSHMTGTPSFSIDEPWSMEDFEKCVSLILKAKHHGKFDAVKLRVHHLESANMSAGQSSAMNDAAKRLREELPETVEASGYTGDMTSLMMGVPMASNHAGWTLPDFSEDPPDLPAGIQSVEQWGRCLVTFGKYNRAKTYSQIAQEKVDGVPSYRNFLFSHYASGSAQLRDLVHYLKAVGLQAKGPVIPGTTIPREFT